MPVLAQPPCNLLQHLRQRGVSAVVGGERAAGGGECAQAGGEGRVARTLGEAPVGFA